jgi:serine phosphatase RsbU (regulator of sigma subunit)
LRERRLAGATQSQNLEDQSGMPSREVDGVLYLDSRAVSRNLSGVSHDVLRALAAECAAVLESARLMEAEQAARQYRQEMEIAASIQRSLISEPEIVCDFARVNGRSIPCKEVGGDFFDVFVAPHAVTVIVADVSGKGISAALLASVIHGMFYAQVSSGAGLADAVTAINRFLCSRVAGQKYATLVAARLRREGTLEMVNCGHVPPIVAQEGEIVQITDGDPPVGLLPQVEFHAEEFALGRVEQHAADADAVNATLVAVEGFCGSIEAQDDRTLVVLERTT